MTTIVRLIPALLIALAACTDAPTSSNSVATPARPELRSVPTGTPEGCPTGTTGASGALPGSGALYLICVPPGFDAATGSLVLYAPGSVPPQLPLAIRDDAIDGQRVSQIITGLGLAFATTSYRQNGLIIVEGTRDLQRLAAKFGELYGPLGGATYGVGVSEGAQVVTLATERHTQLFDGALAACGPIGDFQRQLNYYGDVRLVFDFLFGPVLAPLLPQLGLTSLGPLDAVPEQVIQLFGTPNQPGPLALLIAQVVVTNPALTNELLTRAGLPSNSTLPTRRLSSMSSSACWDTASCSATTRPRSSAARLTTTSRPRPTPAPSTGSRCPPTRHRSRRRAISPQSTRPPAGSRHHW